MWRPAVVQLLRGVVKVTGLLTVGVVLWVVVTLTILVAIAAIPGCDASSGNTRSERGALVVR